jgi:hypothetical protein
MDVVKPHKCGLIFQVILIAIPILIYVWYIYKFGVNVPFVDDWLIVDLYRSLYSHQININNFWLFHNGHRLFFPKILFLAISYFTKLNIKIMMYVSFAFLTGSFYLIFLFYKKLHNNLWFFVPVSWILFSWVQWEDTLWGYQLAWYMILFFTLLTFYFLENLTAHKSFIILSIISAIIASYSSLQGLIVWPSGVFFIIMKIEDRKNKSLWQKIFYLWMVTGIFSIFIYLYGFNFQDAQGSSIFYFLYHPLNTINYFLSSAGAVIVRNPNKLMEYIPKVLGPIGIKYFNSINAIVDFVTVALILLFFFYIVFAVFSFLRLRNKNKDVLYFLLILYGVLFDLLTLVGRSHFGVAEAFSSRYTLYNLLLFVGVYFVLLSMHENTKAQNCNNRFEALLFKLFFILILIQIILSFPYGIYQGKLRRDRCNLDANSILFYETLKDPAILAMEQNDLDDTSLMSFLRDKHLSLFTQPRSFRLFASYIKVIDQYPKYKQAIDNLFKIYLTNFDLQNKYSYTDKDFVEKLIIWAVNTGVKTNTFVQELVPFADQYKELIKKMQS